MITINKSIVSLLFSLCLIVLSVTGVRAEISEDQKQELLKIKESAQEGKMLNCPFTLNTPISDVLADPEWGEPESKDLEFGEYNYASKGVSFLVNNPEENKLAWIFRIAPLSDKIVPADIKNVIGEPTDEKNDYYSYELGEYLLLFTWGMQVEEGIRVHMMTSVKESEK